ncbi:MAG: site-specific integrase [Rickettsiales bacterium]|jgi:integrase|nr:site-specific integrase [Rickettsiales bacterium]
MKEEAIVKIVDRFNFTEAAVSRLPLAMKEERYLVKDTNTKGLVLRVGKTDKVYYLFKKVNRKDLHIKLGSASEITLRKARELVVSNFEQIVQGKNPNEEKKRLHQDLTLKEFFEGVYFPQHAKIHKKPASCKNDEGIMNTHLVKFHNRKMLDITHREIESLHRSIGSLGGLYIANRTLALLRHMFNRAIAWGFPGENPALHIKMFKEKSRDRFLQSSELKRFHEALAIEPNENFRNYVLLSLYCGQRRSNMLSLRWENVNFEEKHIYIPDTKTGEPQFLPLAREPLELLENMKTVAASPFLFPSVTSKSGHLMEPKRAWKSLLKRAGIENLRLHDLRRTFASYQAISGSNLNVIGKALGDKSTRAIAIYSRLSMDPVRDSIQTGISRMNELAGINPKHNNNNEVNNDN